MVNPLNTFVVRIKLSYLVMCQRIVCVTGRIDVQPVSMVMGILF